MITAKDPFASYYSYQLCSKEVRTLSSRNSFTKPDSEKPVAFRIFFIYLFMREKSGIEMETESGL